MSLMDNLKRWARSGDDYDYDEDEDMTSAWAMAAERSADRPRSGREVSIRTTTRLRVTIAQPKRLEDLPVIAGELKAGMTVILNLENQDRELIRRTLDVLSGVAYGLDATVSRIASNTYMIVPFNVEFEGSLLDELTSSGVLGGDVLGGGFDGFDY